MKLTGKGIILLTEVVVGQNAIVGYQSVRIVFCKRRNIF
jgi:hypothetical protein